MVMKPSRPSVSATLGICTSILVLAAVFCAAPPPVSAQTDLGAQRIATSSGTFLKIAVDARGAALAGTYNALVSGPEATFLNPAGIFVEGERPGVHVSYVRWPADIQIGAVAYSRPFDPLGGQLAIGALVLGTTFEETTEFYPTGTGRDLSYSDFLGTLSYSRFFTDRLSIGVSLKYVREDLGSNVGGPVSSNVLFDAGTVYRLGYRNAKLAITLSHFGPDFSPNGNYVSNVNGSEVEYTSFAPPTSFQLGFAIDAWSNGPHRLVTASQVVHPADQNETFRAAGEYWFQEKYALRAGYDFAADEMAFAAGLGLQLDFSGRVGTLDYAFTEGGNLNTVHRWSLGIAL